MVEALQRYAFQGVETGGFLRAVLENGLKGAADRADAENMPLLGDYVGYCWNNIPARSWGSPEAVKNWLAERAAERTPTTG